MNDALDQLAAGLDLPAPEHEGLRLAFGHACVLRVQHLLEEPDVMHCLDVLGLFLQGRAGRDALAAAAQQAVRLANSHRGSASIDGCGHAAVSASYAVANALQGKALQAASYAAYAAVYAQGGSAAVADRGSFEPEFRWQCASLQSLAASERMMMEKSQ
ncbi:hypothetical protein ACFPOE_13750 [Caenimonas terrae]|uniref:Uncharacterized protein n=1 Tax=Caenimonas terrae TaxID=696074 RepID=A0ABW0NE50_9BURK